LRNKKELDPVLRAEAEIERAIARARLIKSRRFAIVGDVLVTASEADPELRRTISKALSNADLTKADRELIAGLISGE